MHVVEHRAEDPGAPVIVLVHGLLDSCVSFEGVVRELAPEFTVVVYDRRGWGRSRDLTPADSLADHADDLLVVAGERRVTVVGHSYGGAVALMAAARRPDRVASIGVFEPTVAWTDWWPDPETLADRSAGLQPLFRRWREGLARPAPEERAANQQSAARDLSFVADAPFSFDDVSVPCVVGGSVDTTPWDFETGGRLSAILGAELVSFEDAGHTAHRTHPREFADFARRATALVQSR